jgi:hypothetical protein
VKKPAFASEVDLCSAFLAAFDQRAWVAYPETCSWDILMVRKADGFQVGIQAKLKLNTDIINQALDEYGGWSASRAGPDCRALLVPAANGFSRICQYLGLVVIVADPPGVGYQRRVYPQLPGASAHQHLDTWPEWAPSKRHKLPEYVPDVPAGASGPVQLTDWKIRAIKLAILLDHHGEVHRTDFAYLQLDPRRWVEGKWLIVENGALKAGPGMPNFKQQHPKVYGQIADEMAKWADPKRAGAPQKSLVLL